MVRSALTTTALACIAATGCTDATAAPHGALVVTVASSTVVALRTPADRVVWGQIPVEVTLRNPTASTIRVYSCGPTAERETSAGWQVAIEPYCLLSGPGYVEMAPGSERTQKTQITGALSGPGGPEFLNGTLAGRYRVLYRFSLPGVEGPLDEARSAPFEVTE